MAALPQENKSFLAPTRVSKIENDEYLEKYVAENTTKQIGYTLGGNPEKQCPTCDILLKDGSVNPDCFAKRVIFEDNTEMYYAKMGNGGFLFDPWGIYSEGSQNKFAKTHGKSVWTFREISKKSFTLYLKFLQTRNTAWKLNAEREVRNG